MNIQDFFTEAYITASRALEESGIEHSRNGSSIWSFYFELTTEYEADEDGDVWPSDSMELRVSNHDSPTGPNALEVRYRDPATSDEGTVIEDVQPILDELRADILELVAGLEIVTN